MNIIVDVDDVCCQFVDNLLRWYNLDFDDNLAVNDINDWDLLKFVKPECGTNVYNYFSNENLYRQCEPVENALFGVNALRKNGHNVYFATSVAVGGEGIKYRWLVRNGFLPNHFTSKKYYIEISEKKLLYADYIIDDGVHNLENFLGGRILFNRPWNQDKKGVWFRAMNWLDALDLILYK